jgi:hypothetical protein
MEQNIKEKYVKKTQTNNIICDMITLYEFHE